MLLFPWYEVHLDSAFLCKEGRRSLIMTVRKTSWWLMFFFFICSPAGTTFITPLAFNNQQLCDLMRNFVNGQSGCCSYLELQISEPHRPEEAQWRWGSTSCFSQCIMDNCAIGCCEHKLQLCSNHWMCGPIAAADSCSGVRLELGHFNHEISSLKQRAGEKRSTLGNLRLCLIKLAHGPAPFGARWDTSISMISWYQTRV